VVGALMLRVPKRADADDCRDSGFILVAVIGVLLVLAIVAQGYSLAIQSHVRLANAEVERARALALAEAGVHLAIHNILEKQNSRSPNRAELVAPKTWDCRVGEDRLTIIVADEAGRIDLNTADSAVIEALLKGLGIERDRSTQLAAAIIDYRDSDDERLPGGAEAEDYKSLGLIGLPKNAPFDVVEELAAVRGIDEDLMRRILPFVTVYSGHSGIDPSVAPVALLSLLEVDSLGPSSSIRIGQRNFRLPHGIASPSPRRTYRILATGWTFAGGGAALEVILQLGAGRGSNYGIRRWQQVPVETGAERAAAALPPC